jgi:hypothetical protein
MVNDVPVRAGSARQARRILTTKMLVYGGSPKVHKSLHGRWGQSCKDPATRLGYDPTPHPPHASNPVVCTESPHLDLPVTFLDRSTALCRVSRRSAAECLSSYTSSAALTENPAACGPARSTYLVVHEQGRSVPEQCVFLHAKHCIGNQPIAARALRPADNSVPCFREDLVSQPAAQHFPVDFPGLLSSTASHLLLRQGVID